MTERNVAVAAVAAAMLASALLIGFEGEDQTFYGDEWGYAARAANPLGEALFEVPSGKYLLVVPMAFYVTLFETVGLDNYLPYRALGIVLLLVCAGLFFALARRGTGDLAAVPPTVLLLFFGAAWDVVITPLRIPALFAVAAGLGMLLCLERRDRWGDLGAAGLLAVALASHPTGLAFAVAAAVIVALRPSPPGTRRPIWVPLGPVALYAAWWVLVRDPGGGGGAQLGNLSETPVFMAESFTAATAAITGVATLGGPGVLGVDQALDDPLTWLAALAVAVTIGIGMKLRSKPVSPLFWALLAALLALWTFTALAPRDVDMRPAASGRYLFPSAVLLLLLLAELVRGARLPRAVPWIASLILALGVAYNVSQLTNIADQLRLRADETRGYVSALELVRGRVDPSFLSEPAPASSLQAGAYYEYAPEFGTPALSPSELEDSPPLSRAVADRVLAEGLRVHLEREDSPPSRPGPSPRFEAEAGTGTEAGHSCIRLRPAGISLQDVALPPGGAWLRSDQLAEISVSLGRFDTPAFRLTPPSAGTGALLSIPTDHGAVPWRVRVSSPVPTWVCGLPG